MIWPWVLVLSALPPVAGDGPPVRLPSITCAAVPDADLRAALRVELHGRLLDVAAPPTPDFVLVSVSCVGEALTLLAVRQGAGSPARRDVPLGGLAPEARPRAIALAIAELLRVDLARNAPPAVERLPPPIPARTVSFGGGFLAGGYFSGTGQQWLTGNHLRVALESPAEPGSGRWGWGVALEIASSSLLGSRFDLLTGASLVARRPGAELTPELALGARLGPAWDYTLDASPKAAIIGGPFASAALEVRSYGRGFGRIGAEGGFDFGVRGGGWASWLVGGGFRF